MMMTKVTRVDNDGGGESGPGGGGEGGGMGEMFDLLGDMLLQREDGKVRSE